MKNSLRGYIACDGCSPRSIAYYTHNIHNGYYLLKLYCTYIIRIVYIRRTMFVNIKRDVRPKCDQWSSDTHCILHEHDVFSHTAVHHSLWPPVSISLNRTFRRNVHCFAHIHTRARAHTHIEMPLRHLCPR